MKKIIIVLAIMTIAIFMQSSFAQEWSKEQKEVWDIIETHWKYYASEDTGNFLKNFHPDFKGFVNWRTLPLNKENLGKWTEWMNKNVDVSIYTIEPVAINVFDNVAVAQYYCDISLKIPPGKEERSSYRYTDVLKKDKNSWLVISAHKEKME